MHKKIKAVVIEPVGGHGGMAPYDFNLCNGLADAGVDIALSTCPETKPPVPPRFDLRLVYRGVFTKGPGWKRGLGFLWAGLRTFMQCLLERRTICHFHFFKIGLLEFVNVLLAKIFCRKVVITAHDVESLYSGLDFGKLPGLAYGMADAIIAHNQVSRQALIENRGLSPAKVHIIPAGNHLGSLPQLPERAEARERLGLPREGRILLFFGQIKEIKGLDVLLQGMPAILEAFPDTALVIAGRPMRIAFDRYETQIRELGIQAHCICRIGFIPDEDLASYYQACDLVTLPYRRIYQSDVLLMAMSYGRPVLTSDIPGMLEIVQDRKTGLVFRNGDAQDLARRVQEAFEHPDLLATVAQGGRALMKNRYDWTSIGKSTANLYASL